MLSICSKEGCGWTTNGKFCGRCGAATIPYFLKCPHCKKQITAMSKFCEECGKPVQEEVRAYIALQRKEVNGEEERKKDAEEMVSET